MSRLQIHSNSTNVFLLSKTMSFRKANVNLRSILVMAGLYKPTRISAEYGLMVTSLTSELSTVRFQFHGKRRKRTAALTSLSTNNKRWLVLDKILHELLPRITEFKTQKLKKSLSTKVDYLFRIRHAFRPLPDFQDLLTLDMLEKNKGVYLPLTLHFKLVSSMYCRSDNENFLRALRLPFYFFAKRPTPAFDDPVEFNQIF